MPCALKGIKGEKQIAFKAGGDTIDGITVFIIGYDGHAVCAGGAGSDGSVLAYGVKGFIFRNIGIFGIHTFGGAAVPVADKAHGLAQGVFNIHTEADDSLKRCHLVTLLGFVLNIACPIAIGGYKKTSVFVF